MQSAKKLVLVDEFDREYKRLQTPTAAVIKANHSLSLSNTLRDSSLFDDRKVKEYVEELHRYLNVNNKEPSSKQSTSAINWLTEPQHVQPCKRAAEKRKKQKKENRPSCHAHVTMGPILMHSTALHARPVVFPASATYSVTADDRRLTEEISQRSRRLHDA